MIAEYQGVIHRLEDLARERGLDFDPVVFQIADSDEIAEVASMGLPNRVYALWRNPVKLRANGKVYTYDRRGLSST